MLKKGLKSLVALGIICHIFPSFALMGEEEFHELLERNKSWYTPCEMLSRIQAEELPKRLDEISSMSIADSQKWVEKGEAYIKWGEDGGDNDRKKLALNCFKKAAKENNAEAFVNLGRLCSASYGFLWREYVAAYYFKKAADHPDYIGGEAHYYIGSRFKFADYCKRDWNKALDYFNEASHRGYKKADTEISDRKALGKWQKSFDHHRPLEGGGFNWENPWDLAIKEYGFEPIKIN